MAAALLVLFASVLMRFSAVVPQGADLQGGPSGLVEVLPNQIDPPIQASGLGVYLADEVPVIPASAGLGDVLDYLNSGGDGDFVILKLPESKKFSAYGDPKFVTTADYMPGGKVRR
jgi:hypothetical protein